MIIYRIFFHPLAKVPGPKLFAASRLPILYLYNIQGTWVRDAISFHAKYGPIVRIGPDSLSVDGSVGYPEIWSQKLHGKSEYTKHIIHYDDYYRGSILTADTKAHRGLRRLFAPAFTEKAIRSQEPILQRITTFLTQQLSKRQGETIDLAKWINYTTFDISGELNLGESFHGVEDDRLHFWIEMIFESLRASSMLRFFREYTWLRIFLPLLATKEIADKKENHENVVLERVHKRMEAGADAKQDFMTHFMAHVDDGKLNVAQVRVHANIFILAGSETSSMASSVLLYYLCKEPEAYRELTTEIRSAFASEDEITVLATAKLAYLNMCLMEAMRLQAPAPDLQPRTSPGDYVGGYWVPEGVCLLLLPISLPSSSGQIPRFDLVILTPPLHDHRPKSPSPCTQHPETRSTFTSPTPSVHSATPPRNHLSTTRPSHRTISPPSSPSVRGRGTVSVAIWAGRRCG